MNELREKIEDAVRKYDYDHATLDDSVAYILDAVIAALPEDKHTPGNVYHSWRNEGIHEVKVILQAAKESK